MPVSVETMFYVRQASWHDLGVQVRARSVQRRLCGCPVWTGTQ